MKHSYYNTRIAILTLASILMGFSSLSQTGAAGVGNSATNIVWLDANAMSLTNGTGVGICTDFSGNGNDFNQVSSSLQPIYTTGVLNGMPVFTYDGVDDILTSGSITGLETSNITYFIVFQRSNLTSQFLIDCKYSSSAPKWRTYCNSNNNKLISAHYSPSIKHVNYVDAGTPTFLSHHITTTTNRNYNAGVLQLNGSAIYTAPIGHLDIGLGNIITPSASNYTLNGYIAELLIYNTAINALERVLIENYLGAKYGIAIATDLFSYQATHSIELIGIGDNGTDTQTDALGKGVAEIYAPVSMTSGEYLLAASTNIALTSFTTSDMPPSIPSHKRWIRTWRVDETGDVGSLSLRFHLSGGNNFGSPASYRLLVDTDGNFTDATVITGAFDAGPQTITFNVDLSAGDYFTLAGLSGGLKFTQLQMVIGVMRIPGIVPVYQRRLIMFISMRLLM